MASSLLPSLTKPWSWAVGVACNLVAKKALPSVGRTWITLLPRGPRTCDLCRPTPRDLFQ
eukprot:4720601-Pyramimonas_sp.AAC.1